MHKFGRLTDISTLTYLQANSIMPQGATVITTFEEGGLHISGQQCPKFSSKTTSIFACLSQKLYLVIGKWILGKLHTYYQRHKPCIRSWTALTLTVLFSGKQLRLILRMASSSTCPLRRGISTTSGCMLWENILTTSQSDAASVCSSPSSALAKEQIIVILCLY